MEAIFACLGIHDNAFGKDLPSPKAYSTLSEKPSGPYEEKKSTFTVLVTGMGVS